MLQQRSLYVESTLKRFVSLGRDLENLASQRRRKDVVATMYASVIQFL